MFSNFEEPQLPNLHLDTKGARNASHARKSRYSLALWPTLKEQSTWKSFDANLSSLNELVCELVKQSETSKSLDGSRVDPVLMPQLISSPAYIPGFRSLRTCKAMKSFDTAPEGNLSLRTVNPNTLKPVSYQRRSSYTFCVPWATRVEKRTVNKWDPPSHLIHPNCKVSHIKLNRFSPKESNR